MVAAKRVEMEDKKINTNGMRGSVKFRFMVINQLI